MERTMSVEEKIRRAEEIYERRRQGSSRPVTKVSVNNKKDIKLLRKMVIQVLICTSIYLIIYAIHQNQYVFSEDFIRKTNEILSYDTNFGELYEKAKNQIMLFLNLNQNGIGGAEEPTTEAENSNNETVPEEKKEDQEENKSQVEQDIELAKSTTTYIKPIEGTITSGYGQRENANPKNHTGTDIAAPLGTKIKAAAEGEVVIASEEGDYGKHLKVQIGEISIIYAHCNNLYVKQGDKITQGQEIAEVGSTGNSTGPHLHYEMRVSERTIDPQSILEL